MAAITTSPNVSATPTWPSAPVWASTTTAPVPAKTRANVPRASASAARQVAGAVASLDPDSAAMAARASAAVIVAVGSVVGESGQDRPEEVREPAR